MIFCIGKEVYSVKARTERRNYSELNRTDELTNITVVTVWKRLCLQKRMRQPMTNGLALFAHWSLVSSAKTKPCQFTLVQLLRPVRVLTVWRKHSNDADPTSFQKIVFLLSFFCLSVMCRLWRSCCSTWIEDDVERSERWSTPASADDIASHQGSWVVREGG